MDMDVAINHDPLPDGMVYKSEGKEQGKWKDIYMKAIKDIVYKEPIKAESFHV